MNAPANIHTNLPVLIGELPSGEAASPHNRFTRERQVVFLEALAESGSVRSAARRAGVSHQTVYRAKRACRVLRKCVDAALLCARDHAEEALRCRAVDGVEEEVLYHGEVVATRTRYCSRLLLAHLGRLDKLAEREEVSALAEGFDAALAAFAQGDDTLGEELPETPHCVPAQAGTSHRGSPSHEAPACAGARAVRVPAEAGSSGGGSDGGSPSHEVPASAGTHTGSENPAGPDGQNPSPAPCNTRSIGEDAIRREAWASPAFWASLQWYDDDYGAEWRMRVAEMLAARKALGDAGADEVADEGTDEGTGEGADEGEPLGPPPFELLAEWEDETGERQYATLETLQQCLEEQVLGFARGASEWWLRDWQGHVRQDVQAAWARAAAEDDRAADLREGEGAPIAPSSPPAPLSDDGHG